MNNLSLFTGNTINVLSIINTALQHNYISSARADSLYCEMETLSNDLVMYFNHGTSTSLDKNDFIRIWDTINYMFIHGFNEDNQSYYCLKTKNIRDYFNSGLECVKKDILLIQEILEQLKNQKLPINNERYSSILYEQIPDFLQSLKKYYAIFNYCYIAGDLDYPLYDGLPLYHDMYNLKGSDLALHYLKCFSIENAFCYEFYKELPELVQQFEDLKGIPIYYLGINIFELVLYQDICHILLYNSSGILLEETDIGRIKNRLENSVDMSKDIEYALKLICSSLPDEMSKYIWRFKNEIKKKFESFINDDFELLIYRKAYKTSNVILLNSIQSNQHFLKILTHIQSLTDIEEKIIYLQNIKINIYDLFDLLENDIFVGNEYNLYFSTLTPNDIAIIIKALIPDLGVFNQKCSLDDELYSELDCGVEWKKKLIDFLKKYSILQKKEVEYALNNIKII